jgi:hypothetical protein
MAKKRSSTRSEQPAERHFRDRVVRLDRIRSGDLVLNPKNWRTHPEAQKAALKGVLSEIGWTDALIARERPDGRLELVDGHLRSTLDPDEIVPVLVVDVSEEESDKLLTILDPLSAMAGVDVDKLNELLGTVSFESPDMSDLLDILRSQSIEAELQNNASSGDVEAEPGPAVTETESAAVGTGFVNMAFPVTTMQEIEIRKAIKKAKERWQVESSGMALAMILEEWIQTNG